MAIYFSKLQCGDDPEIKPKEKEEYKPFDFRTAFDEYGNFKQ